MRFARFVGVLLAWGSSLLAASAYARDAVGFSRGYGPRSRVLYARPTVEWQVWAQEGSHITSYRMRVNGAVVPARYDEQTKTMRYTPPAPLSPGSYDVKCDVEVDGILRMDRHWSFDVHSDAVPELQQPSEAQLALMAEVNRYRRDLGLPDFKIDARLASAGAGHVKYLVLNNRNGHQELIGDRGFFGQIPQERLEAYDFLGDSWECVAYGDDSMHDAVRSVFDAPYHRIPFMQPGELIAGGDFGGKRVALEFEMVHTRQTVVSPADGQTGIPCSWRNSEHPSPLVGREVYGAVGYPIMLCHFNPNDKPIKEVTATLTMNGESIPCYLNTPETDSNLKFALILIPEKPLSPMTKYTVDVQAKNDLGQQVRRRWSFTTGPS
ncbi:MAG: hypothetical protein JSS72_06315 [Armatimonadetes bacterium]|nr:hypothetical protein [Armatimonadota bacterium]